MTIRPENNSKFEQVIIEDNGVGLNKDNFDRFNELFNTSKGKGNRGSGRIQYVHSFQNVYFNSCYEEDSKILKRSFSYNKKNGKNFLGEYLFDDLCVETTTGTKLTLANLKLTKDQLYYNNLKAELLKNELLVRYIFKFYNNIFPKIDIVTFINGKKVEVMTINSADIPQQKNEVSFDVNKVRPVLQPADPQKDEPEKIKWEKLANEKETLTAINFQFPESVMRSNRITLYSQGVAIQNITFPDIIKTKEVIENSRFLTVIKGKFLDGLPLSDDGRSNLKFADKDTAAEDARQGNLFNDEPEGQIFFDTIREAIKDSLPKFYPVLQKIEKQRDDTVESLARTFHISQRTIKMTKFDLADDSPEKLLAKLYMTESKALSKKDVKIKELIDSINDLNPSDDKYRTLLEEKGKELMALIPKQNAAELTSYIARREIAAHLLDKILSQETTIQKKTIANAERKKDEELLHNIFIKKRTNNSSDTSGLWILSEDYLYFQGHSEAKLKELKINGKNIFIDNVSNLEKEYGVEILSDKRPDICLFPEEGKCIIIEFKAPDVKAAEYITQIPRYARLIANCLKPEFKIKQYYGYLIAEEVNDYEVMQFTKGVENGTWFDPKIPLKGIGDEEDVVKGFLYQEIIKWSALRNRAFSRNRKFAEILGIRDQKKDGKKIAT